MTPVRDAGDVDLTGEGDSAVPTDYLRAEQYPLARIPGEL